MSNTTEVADRIANLVRRHNSELASQAVLKAGFGAVFCFFIFGLIFMMALFPGFFFAHYLDLYNWQFALFVTGLLLVVATWSAWRRVDPMVGLKPLTKRQLALTLISQASPHILYFSPRHASAGFALLLLGGPSNVFEGLGIWCSRLRADGSLFMAAADLLAQCENEYPAGQIRDPGAAVLLRQLALAKVLPREDSAVWTVTDKGYKVLFGGKRKLAKQTDDEGNLQRKRSSKKKSDQE